jgi:hypothetical protein
MNKKIKVELGRSKTLFMPVCLEQKLKRINQA